MVRSALGTLARLVGALLVAALISGLAYYGWTFARASPRFGVRHLSFRGVVHANEEELTRRAGLVAGTNIFRIDLARAAREMEQDPWVRQASIERELPDTLRVSVTEHRPVAILALGPLYVLDDHNRIFKRVTPTDHLDLPVITGLTREMVEQGRDADALVTARSIVAAWARLPLAAYAPLGELHADFDAGERTWTAWAGDRAPVRVELGSFDFEGPAAVPAVLGRLERVWTELERRHARPKSIDVGNRLRPDWVAVELE